MSATNLSRLSQLTKSLKIPSIIIVIDCVNAKTNASVISKLKPSKGSFKGVGSGI